MNDIDRPVAKKSLYTLIITRPQKQSDPWFEYAMQHGIDYLSLPALEIKSLHTAWDIHQREMLERADILIVTSANCIDSAPFSLLQQLREGSFKIVTLGQGTSNALKAHHIQAFLTAPDGTTSESLLALPFFEAEKLSSKNIIILSGQGGRHYLEETLSQRHARVHRIALYQRICPAGYPPETLQAVQRCAKPIFIITSQEALTNIIKLFPETAHLWLKAQLFIFVSERILDYAKTLGFTQLWNVQSLAISKIHAFIDAELLSV